MKEGNQRFPVFAYGKLLLGFLNIIEAIHAKIEDFRCPGNHRFP